MTDAKNKDKEQTAGGPGPDEDAVATVKIGFLGRLRAYFLAGILITAPIFITFYLAWLFIHFVDIKVTPLIPLK